MDISELLDPEESNAIKISQSQIKYAQANQQNLKRDIDKMSFIRK